MVISPNCALKVRRGPSLSAVERIQLLGQTKDEVWAVADKWVDAAASAKQIPVESPLVGEEWLSGPLCGDGCMQLTN